MTVDRVATAMQSQSMLAQLLKTQKSMIDAQVEVTTGRRINNFADDPASLGGLMAARSADAQTADFLATAKSLRTRLDLQDTQINSLGEAASGLRQTILDAVANNSGASLNAEMQSTLDQFKTILNGQSDGQYIYGGTRQDVPPVTVSSVADLAALPATANAFQNNQTTQSAKIDTSQTVNYGQLASDLGGPMFDLMRQYAAFNAGPNGPISGDLTPAQSTFLTNLANTAASAATGINDHLGANGVAFRETDDAVNRHDDTRTALAGMISDIQDVDMASAVDKLNNAQLAMQASAKTYATVQGISLLNFLPAT